jgi:hypothetical protein
LKRGQIWLSLAAICLIQVVILWRLHPSVFFGFSLDDAIYFSSAKALAEGKGYVLEWLPGSPAATKHPFFYPWLLSWVWRWNPSFPQNLSLAAGINVVFTLAFVIVSFLFVQRFKGVGDTGALVVAACCAMHPTVLLYSVNLLTDIPFAAVALLAMLLMAGAVSRKTGLALVVCSGILAGIAMLIRVLGMPIAAGLLLALLLRRQWRKALAFAVTILPFFVGLLWNSFLSRPATPPVAGTASCSRWWQLSWIYYTSYQEFWKSSAIERRMFWSYVSADAKHLVYQLGAYFFDLQRVRLSPVTITLFLLVFVISVRGMVRLIQINGWRPVHLSLALYLLPVLAWEWPSPERFLLPFLPLILAGGWTEAAYIVTTIFRSLERDRSVATAVSAGLCVLTGVAVLCSLGVSWWRGVKNDFQVSDERASFLADKREAYNWIEKNSPTEAKVISYEVAATFLYSERQGMSPTILSPAGKEQQDLLEAQLRCLLAPAEPIGANYWLVADDDFRLEWPAAIASENTHEREMERSLPLLFRTSAGHVRIYSLPYR